MTPINYRYIDCNELTATHLLQIGEFNMYGSNVHGLNVCGSDVGESDADGSDTGGLKAGD